MKRRDPNPSGATGSQSEPDLIDGYPESYTVDTPTRQEMFQLAALLLGPVASLLWLRHISGAVNESKRRARDAMCTQGEEFCVARPGAPDSFDVFLERSLSATPTTVSVSSHPVNAGGAPGSVYEPGSWGCLSFLTPRCQCAQGPLRPSRKTTNCSTATPGGVSPAAESPGSRACSAASPSSSPCCTH